VWCLPTSSATRSSSRYTGHRLIFVSRKNAESPVFSLVSTFMVSYVDTNAISVVSVQKHLLILHSRNTQTIFWMVWLSESELFRICRWSTTSAMRTFRRMSLCWNLSKRTRMALVMVSTLSFLQDIHVVHTTLLDIDVVKTPRSVVLTSDS
jgi:hypothetical protein